AATRVVGLSNGSPMPVDAKDGHHVIGVVVGLKIKNERRKSVYAQGRGRQHRSFKAVRRLLLQDATRRPGCIRQVVRHFVQIALNTVGSSEAAQLAQLGRSEAEVVVLHGLSAVYRIQKPQGIRRSNLRHSGRTLRSE